LYIVEGWWTTKCRSTSIIECRW